MQDELRYEQLIAAPATQEMKDVHTRVKIRAAVDAMRDARSVTRLRGCGSDDLCAPVQNTAKATVCGGTGGVLFAGCLTPPYSTVANCFGGLATGAIVGTTVCGGIAATGAIGSYCCFFPKLVKRAIDLYPEKKEIALLQHEVNSRLPDSVVDHINSFL